MPYVKRRKNPVSQAFGIVLRRTRERRSIDYGTIEKNSGITPSYMKLIEQGTFNLHVSKCLGLYNAFTIDSDSYFSLEALIQMLSIISILEAKGNANEKKYMEGLKEGALEIMDYDPKIFKLLDKFIAYGLFESTDSNIAHQIIVENEIDGIVEQFLTNYSEFAASPEDQQLAFLRNFFINVPSISYEYLQSSRDSLLKLPFQISYSGLWEWEEQNRKNLVSRICISDDPDGVTSKLNLNRYRYEHMWEPQFERNRFIFFNTDNTAEKILKDFRVNLHDVYRKSGDKTIFNRFDKGVVKFLVKVVSTDRWTKYKDSVGKLLTPPVKAKKKAFSALWIFTLKQGYMVSFLADIDKDKDLVIDCISLDFEDTIERFKMLDKMWDTL